MGIALITSIFLWGIWSHWCTYPTGSWVSYLDGPMSPTEHWGKDGGSVSIKKEGGEYFCSISLLGEQRKLRCAWCCLESVLTLWPGLGTQHADCTGSPGLSPKGNGCLFPHTWGFLLFLSSFSHENLQCPAVTAASYMSVITACM